MICATRCRSPVGELLLAACGESLVGLWLRGQRYYPYHMEGEFQMRETPVLRQTRAWLDRYFAGERPEIGELDLAPAGSGFRRDVWRILAGIPYGTTTTYGEIAREMAARMGREHMSAQAVGGAVGHNPISIIIPCHRVVRADGGLAGYAGGLEVKAWLLAHEDASRG